MNLPGSVPGAAKLVEYVLSGFSSVAGPLLAPWAARRKADAKRIEASGEADALRIVAAAQAEVAGELIAADLEVEGEVALNQTVEQAMHFNSQRRLGNIESVVRQAQEALGESEAPDTEPNHDWTARFFGQVQDISDEELQAIWAKILAGEVKRPGSVSLRTLSLLKDIDQVVATQFRALCSVATIIRAENAVIDARVPSLGGNAGSNALGDYGLGFGVLNVLNEHGLIIADYNSWFDYRICSGIPVEGGTNIVIPLAFQGRLWRLVPKDGVQLQGELPIHGVALTHAGQELASLVDLELKSDYAEALQAFFQKKGLHMVALEDVGP